MLKKLLAVIAVLFILIIASAIVLPIIFKDDIIAIVKEEANNNVNARLDFGDIGLSMFESFPDFTLTIEDIKVVGLDPFDGVVLADIAELKLSLDLMSVINGEKIDINTIGLLSPNLHVIVLADGRANYDIALPSESPEEVEESSSETSFSIGLKSYYIENANIIYDDRQGGMYANLKNFTHRGSGDFTQDDFLLSTTTTADGVTYRMDGVSYLNSTRLDMKFDVNMNLPNMKFVFDENYVKLNSLHLGFDGMVAMPSEEGDPIDLDMSFETKETSFKSLLSLVPAVFLTDFEDVETDGNLALSGMAKGRMIGDQLPLFALDLKVSDARFQYPDLPKSAEAINIDMHIKNPGGSEDNTLVDINTFHVELAGNPIDVVLHMRTPISDPYIDASIKANLDMASLADVIPLEEGQSLSGKVFSNIVLKGNQSAIDQERYQDFEAAGQLVLEAFDYKDPELPYSTVIKICSLNFSPQYAELTAFNMNVGKSDISLTGRIDNIVQWYVADAPMSGTFNFSSNTMDLNEFMAEDESAEAEEEATEESSGVVEVPAGYDFVLNTSITALIYENLNISNVRGSIVLRDQKIDMNKLAMNLLDGSMTMNGYYETNNPTEPSFDFNMDIIGWDIPQTYEYLVMVQRMAPIMESATGRFSTNMKMAGKMDQNMDPKYNTLDGGGMLTTRNVTLSSPKSLMKIAEAIKYDGVKSMTLDNTKVKYYFEDGRIRVDPTNFIIGKEIPSIFTGSHGFDLTMDYVMNLDIPSRLMGGAATQVVSGLMSQANKALGTNASVPERIKMDVDIKGTTEDPIITPRLAGTAGGSNPVDDLKGQALDELNKKKDELENKARDEADRLKSEAEAKARAEADRLKSDAEGAKAKAEAEARKKADEAKKKAEADAKKKADEAKKKAEAEAKKKAEEEAKKNLNKLFK